MWVWIVRLAIVVSFSALSFRASPAPETSRLILPIVAYGGVPDAPHFQSTFSFVNPSGEEADSVLSIYDNEGRLSTAQVGCSPVAPPPQTIELAIAGRGLAHYTGVTDIPLFDGWGSLQWTGSAPLQGSVEISTIDGVRRPCLLICNRPSTALDSTTLVPAVVPSTRFQAGAIVTPQRHSAFAIVNPSPSEVATTTVSLLASDGSTLQLEGREATFTYRIAPRHRVAALVWTLLFSPLVDDPAFDPPPAPRLPDQFHGSVLVDSDHPVALGGVHVLLPEGKLVAIPVASGP